MKLNLSGNLPCAYEIIVLVHAASPSRSYRFRTITFAQYLVSNKSVAYVPERALIHPLPEKVFSRYTVEIVRATLGMTILPWEQRVLGRLLAAELSRSRVCPHTHTHVHTRRKHSHPLTHTHIYSYVYKAGWESTGLRDGATVRGCWCVQSTPLEPRADRSINRG